MHGRMHRRCMHACLALVERQVDLSALEALGGGLAAVVEEEAELDGDVEDDAEDVGLERGAEAHGGLEVGQATEEAAALVAAATGGLADADAHQAQHVGAGAQLQSVRGARLASAATARWRRWARRWRGRGRGGRRRGLVLAAVAGIAGKERVGHQQRQQAGRREGPGRHCSRLFKLASASGGESEVGGFRICRSRLGFYAKSSSTG